MSLFERLSSNLNRLKLSLRTELFGNVRLRRKLPLPQASPFNEAEFYKLIVSKAIDPLTARSVELVCDVGCRNWSYADGLAQAFSNAALLGIEVDGARRYWNLYRRRDFATAKAVALSLEGRPSEVLFGDFRKLDVAAYCTGYESVAFCFFFPFVSSNPCLKWGLPLEFGEFKPLLAHALSSLEVKPLLLSVHQGQWEAEIARAAYQELNLAPREIVVSSSEYAGLWPSSYDLHVLVSRP